MLKLLLCFVLALCTVQASGDFVILHSPDSLIFTGNKNVEQSRIKGVVAASLGYTVPVKSMWEGMFIKDPLTLPEAAVCIVVEGVNSLGISKGVKYPLHIDEAEETSWQSVRFQIGEKDKQNMLVRIYTADGVDALGHSALGELKPPPIDETSLKALNLKREEDKKFLEEIQLLQAIAKKVPSAIKSDCKSDVYWLVVSGLRPVFDTHGKNSTASREALTLLNNACNAISDAFVKAYNGKVIVAAFTNDASHVRHTRSVTLVKQQGDTDNTQDDQQDENKNVEDEEDININSTSDSESGMSTSPAYNDFHDDKGESEKSDQDLTNKEHKINSNTEKIGQEDLKLSKNYSENYPVIFNIFLWFGVIFVFSLLAICIAIADMDPGRDSIIYRMTSNRMKKDN